MRYPAEHKQETRARILRAAARRFRTGGSEGAAIADLMKDLRLTHGGFYRHFDSKETLFLEALRHSGQQMTERMIAAAEQAPRGGQLKALIDAYLSVEHCDDIAEGCPLATLASELSRHPHGTRVMFERGLKEHTRLIARFMPGATAEKRERTAILLLSGMAGTLGIARAVADDRERRRILDEAKKFYLDALRR